MKRDSISSFGDALYSFVFDHMTTEEITKSGYDKGAIVYITAAAILGMIFISLDFGSTKSGINNKSLFGLNYEGKSWKTFIPILLFWSLGSGFISWVANLLDIFQDTIQSSAIAGFSWIYILTNLIEKYSKPEVIQKDEE